MSTFKVTVEGLESVEDHPNADKLDICRLKSMSYQFVTAKDNYKPGDQVIYFPIDSVLPIELAEEMGISHLVSKSGLIGDVRIRTVKLRKEISQGVVVPPNGLELTREKTWQDGDEVTDLLGIVKYEPPATFVKGATLNPLPNLVSIYDIENAERHKGALGELMDQKVFISEKMEGSHFSITIYNEHGNITVCSRRREIVPDEGSETTWWKTAEKSGLIDALKEMPEIINNEAIGSRWVSISIRGELVGPGIQGNYYKLKDHEIFLFEIELDGLPIGSDHFLRAVKHLSSVHNVLVVPTISIGKTLREWLDGRTVAEASNGKSNICDRKREGIVIKPMTEQWHKSVGRLFLKQRSPEYLAKSKL